MQGLKPEAPAGPPTLSDIAALTDSLLRLLPRRAVSSDKVAWLWGGEVGRLSFSLSEFLEAVSQWCMLFALMQDLHSRSP